MATRASSRRNAGQNISSSPALPTRSTRSRSHDINDDETNVAAPKRRRGPGRPPKQDKTLREDLATIDESSPESALQPLVRKGRKSSGVVSAMSGTTARDSLTDQDLAIMNSEDMIDSLTQLSYYSELMCDLLAPPGGISVQNIEKIAHGLTDPETRPTKNFNKYHTELEGAKSKYTVGAHINVSKALRGILEVRHVDELSTGLWRPDDIFYKANIVATLEDIYKRLSNGDDFPLEKLDRDFPEPFMSQLAQGHPVSTSPGASQLIKMTFELGLEIRTQFALQMLREQSQEPGTDLEGVISEIFYLGDEDTTVRGWEVEGLKAQQLKSSQRQAYAKRIIDITASFTDEAVDLNGLNEKFPLLVFVQLYASWARARIVEISRRLDLAGKPAGIQQAIESELRRRKALSTGPAWVDHDTIHVGNQEQAVVSQAQPQVQASKRYDGPAAMKLLKNLKGQNQNQNPQPPSMMPNQPRNAQNQAPTAPMFEHPSTSSTTALSSLDPALFGDQRPLDAIQLQTTAAQAAQAAQQAVSAVQHAPESTTVLRAILSKDRQNAAEANKENNPEARAGPASHVFVPSLLDRQASASRIDWSSQGPTQIGTAGPSHPAAGEIGSDDEDAFERDQRAPAPPSAQPNRRKRARPQASKSPGKRARFQEVIPDATQNFASPYPNAAYSQPPTASYPEPMDAYYAANQTAKALTAERKQKKAPQKRRPWSIEETTLLHKLIETIGTSWAAIKKHDDINGKVFATRDQVALKDKARNMKFDLLKAHAVLPKNFDAVPLKKSQKDDLKAHNVDLDAMQAEQAAAQDPTF